MKIPTIISLGFVLLINIDTVSAQDILTYQKPPQSIINLVEAASTPTVRISSNGEWMILLDMPDMPSIEVLSEQEIRLAGLRINPATNGPSRSSAFTGIRLKTIGSGEERSFAGLPDKLQLADITWSPEEDKIAFSNTTQAGVELWTADLETMQAKRLSTLYLNDTYGRAFVWTPDGNTLLAKFIDSNRKALTPVPEIPAGPIIQESLGNSAPVPTYQDLLKNPYDENAFDHYFSAQLKVVDLEGNAIDYGPAGIVRSFEYSPDGQYILSSTIIRPYSYAVPISLFPYTTSVYDKQGKLIKKLFDAPLAENLPAGFDAVPKGPREFGWRSDKPAVLYWVEAQDNGNPAQQATVRDVLFTQAVPFNLSPFRLAECYYRFRSVHWGDDKLAIVTERWFRTRAERRVFIKPSNETFRVNLFDRYYEDAYSDPGTFVTRKNEFNRPVLLTEFNALKRLGDQDNVNIFSISDGASPEGDRPFILKFNIKTKLRDTLFRSQAPYYERPLFFDNDKFIVTSRETADSIANYYKVTLADTSYQQITSFTNPYPELAGVKKQKLSYTRLDGITLGGTLYLPKDFKTGDAPLPALIWAYPREFKTASAAGQVKGSPYQFSKIGSGSPIFWVTRGYAILDNADMPVVGESNKEPNDTFVEQIRYNAEAAIDHMVKTGVADPKRIALGGHSYGAFMTASLLAHTDLFAAGIARSGAYNRSLTPFGFQAEERTYWQAPALYNRMSPFSYADKIKTPLLLIHGQADNNTGTFPMQSERLFSALKGHGATTRLVILPAEAHSYRAKESILHMMWEMDQWLEKYVKNK
ncbi:MAG: prolyl oligopeptidase family serine peptidase [Daejeonella sp.]